MDANVSPNKRRQRTEDILTPEQRAEQTARLRRELAEDRQKTPQRKDSLWKDLTAGVINAQIVCPQCQRSGSVRTKKTRQKVGVSGGKATGAVLTGGVSLLVTGLFRKEKVSQAHCGNCGSDWTF
jgi:predicted RNA-binding Zn-ribbon protein involved in translation (DUF1610 family)